jgi:2'-5' RNA ligase
MTDAGRGRYLSPAPDAPSPTLTAVVVPVPAAEGLVEEYRRHLDAAASWGVPAHVTVVYPFVEPSQVDERVVATLGAAIEPVGAFDCRFARTAWFGEDVLWLDPEPAQPFRDLTARVWRAFPQHPPYRGAYPDVVPHLTVAQRGPATLIALRAAERALEPGLPVAARIDQVLLIAGTDAPDSWRILHGVRLR